MKATSEYLNRPLRAELDAARDHVEALKRADFFNSMSDNAYHISGRYDAMRRRIAEAERRVREMEGER